MFGIDKDKIKQAFENYEERLAGLNSSPSSQEKDFLLNIQQFIEELKQAFS